MDEEPDISQPSPEDEGPASIRIDLPPSPRRPRPDTKPYGSRKSPKAKATHQPAKITNTAANLSNHPPKIVPQTKNTAPAQSKAPAQPRAPAMDLEAVKRAIDEQIQEHQDSGALLTEDIVRDLI